MGKVSVRGEGCGRGECVRREGCEAGECVRGRDVRGRVYTHLIFDMK